MPHSEAKLREGQAWGLGSSGLLDHHLELTGGQGCHGGGDQALEAQCMEGAAQKAAGEGQELGGFL